jgi:AMMECR1 domain-containing protein
LLPQVPVNEGWGRAEFLEQVCDKAELPGDCWEWAAIYTFTAEVFGEFREPQ